MFNLILKDIMVQKRAIFLSWIYIIIMIVAFQGTGDKNPIAMMVAGMTFVTYSLTIYACAYDEKNKSDLMLNSLPVSRETIVLSRYVSSFIFFMIGLAEYIMISTIFILLHLPIKAYPIQFEGILAAMVAASITTAAYLPAFFKLGYLKSKMMYFILIFIIIFFSGAAIAIIELCKDCPVLKVINQSGVGAAIGSIVFILAILAISYKMSIKIYKNREF